VFLGKQKRSYGYKRLLVTSFGYAVVTQIQTVTKSCSGQTGHSEVVQVIFDTSIITLRRCPKLFWENHGSDSRKWTRQTTSVANIASFYTKRSNFAIAQQAKQRIKKVY